VRIDDFREDNGATRSVWHGHSANRTGERRRSIQGRYIRRYDAAPMRVIDKLAWIHIEDRRILAVRSRGKTAYFLPGGKREPGESDEDALIREVEEELGVALRRETIQPLGVFEAQAHGQPEGVFVRMACFTGDSTGEPKPAAEIEEMAWLAYADRDRLSLVAQIIVDWLRERQRL
jgi:8-oxo-dGTP pyrophosphatase MutT (NUDIX family)